MEKSLILHIIIQKFPHKENCGVCEVKQIDDRNINLSVQYWYYFASFCVQVNTLKLALEGVEKERDFYFGKLRDVEVLAQEQGQESAQFVERLMEILYSADEQVSRLYLIGSSLIDHS